MRSLWLRRWVVVFASSLLSVVGCSNALQDPVGLVADAGGGTAPAHARTLQRFRLRLRHLHTGESIDVVYRQGDQPVPDSVRRLNHFLRDWRTGQDAHYPVQEFDVLHGILERLNRPGAWIEIVCGYRSPQTNRLLRAGTPATGVAENSQHTLSHAIDLRVPGVSTERVRDAALSLGMGGVGYYPQSGFVHVDVGPVRQWSFGRALHRHAAPTHSRHVHHAA